MSLQPLLTDAKVTLVVSEYGSFVGRVSERLVVKLKGEVLEDLPLFKIEQVLVTTRAATLTTDALRACAEAGIPVSLLGGRGEPYATMANPQLLGTVSTRREQLAAYNDERGGELARLFAVGKLMNQATLLRYFAKYRQSTDRRLWELMNDAAASISGVAAEMGKLEGTADEVRPTLMALEGRAGTMYWDAVSALAPADLGFPGREKRGAADPLNAQLNYGYGILQSQVWIALTLAGLDPYAGFLHADRPGRPSLILDLMEEFRQPVVDRAILAAAGRGSRATMENGRLDEPSRRKVAERVFSRLEARDRFGRKRYALSSIIRLQARAIVAHVRDERPYRPFQSSW